MVNINKKKCRALTKNIITNRWKDYGMNLPCSFFACRKCGDIENLDIHHEIYPRNKKGVINAILSGKIYMLCRIHHQEVDGCIPKTHGLKMLERFA